MMRTLSGCLLLAVVWLTGSSTALLSSPSSSQIQHHHRGSLVSQQHLHLYSNDDLSGGSGGNMWSSPSSDEEKDLTSQLAREWSQRNQDNDKDNNKSSSSSSSYFMQMMTRMNRHYDNNKDAVTYPSQRMMTQAPNNPSSDAAGQGASQSSSIADLAQEWAAMNRGEALTSTTTHSTTPLAPPSPNLDDLEQQAQEYTELIQDHNQLGPPPSLSRDSSSLPPIVGSLYGHNNDDNSNNQDDSSDAKRMQDLAAEWTQMNRDQSNSNNGGSGDTGSPFLDQIPMKKASPADNAAFVPPTTKTPRNPNIGVLSTLETDDSLYQNPFASRQRRRQPIVMKPIVGQAPSMADIVGKPPSTTASDWKSLRPDQQQSLLDQAQRTFAQRAEQGLDARQQQLLWDKVPQQWNELTEEERQRMIQQAQSSFQQLAEQNLSDQQKSLLVMTPLEDRIAQMLGQEKEEKGKEDDSSAATSSSWDMLSSDHQRRLVEEAQTNFVTLAESDLDEHQKALFHFTHLTNEDYRARLVQEAQETFLHLAQQGLTERQKALLLWLDNRPHNNWDQLHPHDQQRLVQEAQTHFVQMLEEDLDDRQLQILQLNAPTAVEAQEERQRLIQQAQAQFWKVASEELDERQLALWRMMPSQGQGDDNDQPWQALHAKDKARLVEEAQTTFGALAEQDLDERQKALLNQDSRQEVRERLIQEAQITFERVAQQGLDKRQRALMNDEYASLNQDDKDRLIAEAKDVFAERAAADLNELQQALLDNSIPTPNTPQEKERLIAFAQDTFWKRAQADLDERQRALMEALPHEFVEDVQAEKTRLIEEAQESFQQQAQQGLNVRQRSFLSSSKARLILEARQVFADRLSSDLTEWQTALVEQTIAVPNTEEERARLIAFAQDTFQKRAVADLDERQKALMTDLYLEDYDKQRLIAEAKESFRENLEADLDERQRAIVSGTTLDEPDAKPTSVSDRSVAPAPPSRSSSLADLAKLWAARHKEESEKVASPPTAPAVTSETPVEPTPMRAALDTSSAEEFAKEWGVMNQDRRTEMAFAKPFDLFWRDEPKTKEAAPATISGDELAKEWTSIHQDTMEEATSEAVDSLEGSTNEDTESTETTFLLDYDMDNAPPPASPMEKSVRAPRPPTAAQLAQEWAAMNQQNRLAASGTDSTPDISAALPVPSSKSALDLANAWAVRNKDKELPQTPSFADAAPITASDLIKPMVSPAYSNPRAEDFVDYSKPINRIGAPVEKKEQPKLLPTQSTPEDFIVSAASTSVEAEDSRPADDFIVETNEPQEEAALVLESSEQPVETNDEPLSLNSQPVVSEAEESLVLVNPVQETQKVEDKAEEEPLMLVNPVQETQKVEDIWYPADPSKETPKSTLVEDEKTVASDLSEVEDLLFTTNPMAGTPKKDEPVVADDDVEDLLTLTNPKVETLVETPKQDEPKSHLEEPLVLANPKVETRKRTEPKPEEVEDLLLLVNPMIETRKRQVLNNEAGDPTEALNTANEIKEKTEAKRVSHDAVHTEQSKAKKATAKAVHKEDRRSMMIGGFGTLAAAIIGGGLFQLDLSVNEETAVSSPEPTFPAESSDDSEAEELQDIDPLL